MRTIVALDLETTGLDPERDTIIEIGAVKFTGNRVEAEFASLVKKHRAECKAEGFSTWARFVAMDKAFNDYELFQLWTEQGVFFVTRLKYNADYRVVKNLPTSSTSRFGQRSSPC